jgi:type IV pilus assembly protein PilC
MNPSPLALSPGPESLMPASRRLPLSCLIELCRVLRHYLGSGLPIQNAFRQQSKRGGLPVRACAGRIATALDRGSALHDALRREEGAFPPLLVSLADVGEQTGMLPEVFAELEKYFQRQQKLRRQLVSQITWPVLQFIMAIAVLAGLIFIMGMLSERQDPHARPLDPLGLGLAGPSGAAIFLAVVLGSLAGAAGLYFALTHTLRQRAATHAFLLGVPALGPCLRSLALSRFCLALRLTTETAMPIRRALALSLRATGNPAFEAQEPTVASGVEAGDDLTLILARTRLFPEEFQEMLAVAEESGQLSEVLRHQANHYHEESSRRLTALTATLGYAIWGFVGLVIIVAIFRIFTWYISQLGV